MFEPLLSRLSDRYHLVAPDYPGFGHSDWPDPGSFAYTFDRYAEIINQFTEAINLSRYTLYMQDYGGPVGFRMALAHPERVEGLIVQDAVAHNEGLGANWATRRAFWADRATQEETLRQNLLSLASTKTRHIGSDPRVELYDPDLWTDEFAFLNAPGQAQIQSDLFYDYRTNVNAYPEWQAGLPRDTDAYMRFVEDIYQSDAYHSLSIEGYSVSAELIDRVRAGNWDPDHHDADRQSRDALAARGYWQAFQVVKANVGEIIGGANPGLLVRNTHREWYRELFQPCVTAGILPARALAGYRNEAVYLRTSRYVPPRWEAVRDAMPAFFDLLAQEREPGVRAVLGHWLFGYIHPYPDGNGRMARFLMNAMLASGGYPWTVVRVEDRNAYLTALDRASIDGDIGPFAGFIAERVHWSMEQKGERNPES